MALERWIMGARFRFRSNSAALLQLVEAAYGGLPPHRLATQDAAGDIDVELCLSPGRAVAGAEPPTVRSRLDQGLLYGVMDDRNYVLVSPGRRRARVFASADMLDQPYHLRYELIEFAVFLLAARCQGLVPLHAGCVGRGGRGVLVLGASGAGKSTLALHCLLQGLEFLSEDAVFVQPDGLLATGVANFLHVHADALDAVDDPGARDWIAGSPIIRRRSGAEKFEADLRLAPGPARLAPAPMQLVGAVVLDARQSQGAATLLTPVAARDVAACLAIDQSYAMAQPGWPRFKTAIARAGVHHLHRGRHPASSVDGLRQLLD
jgi:hypothetical protein